MARYYLIAFDLHFLESLKKTDANLGGALWYAQNDGNIRVFPRLRDVFGDRITPPPQNPTPVPAILSDVIVAKFIGEYYDGCAVGVDTPPARIPPQSVACIIQTGDTDKLPELDNETVVQDMLAFIRNGRNSQLRQGVIQPVFVNDSSREFPLHIVKNGPFLQANASKIEYMAGEAFAIPKEHQCPHIASLIIG